MQRKYTKTSFNFETSKQNYSGVIPGRTLKAKEASLFFLWCYLRAQTISCWDNRNINTYICVKGYWKAINIMEATTEPRETSFFNKKVCEAKISKN